MRTKCVRNCFYRRECCRPEGAKMIREAELFLLADRDAPVHCSYGDAPTWHYLWQLNIARTVLAHDVAQCLGSASSLTDELCRGMWEGTEPEADFWRSMGIYRPRIEVPDDASWVTRYLALTGRRDGVRGISTSIPLDIV